MVVALDRQERGAGQYSAIQEVEQRHNIKVISIITLENMIEYLKNTPIMAESLEMIELYRKQYGI